MRLPISTLWSYTTPLSYRTEFVDNAQTSLWKRHKASSWNTKTFVVSGNIWIHQKAMTIMRFTLLSHFLAFTYFAEIIIQLPLNLRRRLMQDLFFVASWKRVVTQIRPYRPAEFTFRLRYELLLNNNTVLPLYMNPYRTGSSILLPDWLEFQMHVYM